MQKNIFKNNIPRKTVIKSKLTEKKNILNIQNFELISTPRIFTNFLRRMHTVKIFKARRHIRWIRNMRKMYFRKKKLGKWKGDTRVRKWSYRYFERQIAKSFLYEKLRRKRMRRYSRIKKQVNFKKKWIWKYRIMWDRGADKESQWREVCEIAYAWREKVKPEIRLYNFKGKMRNTIVNHRGNGLIKVVKYFNFVWRNIVRKTFNKNESLNFYEKPIWKFRRASSRTKDFFYSIDPYKPFFTFTKRTSEFWKYPAGFHKIKKLS